MQTPQTKKSVNWVTHFPVYYGWVIMAVGTFGLIMTSPGQTYSVSIFIEYFIRDLDLNRSSVSTLYTVATLIGSFALPLIGRQIDRRGPRLLVVVIAALFGAACILMGYVGNAVTLLLGFIAIRMLGQGSLSIVSQNVINHWWVRKRGMVNGISGVLAGLIGLGGFPSLINTLIPLMGWRMTYVVLGAMVLLLMVPIGFVFFRNRPEEYGLLPDGLVPTSEEDDDRSKEVEEDWTLQEAMRTPIFWLLTSSIASVSMLSTGLFFHMVSIFQDNGLSTTIAAVVFVPIALTTALVNLGGGILADHVSVRVLLPIGLLLQALSLWMAQFLQGVELALFYGVILGATSGLVRAVSSVVWAQFFGRRHLGSVQGTASTMLVAGSALGPMPLGIARDFFGSYNLVLVASSFIPILLAILCVLFVARPTKPKNA